MVIKRFLTVSLLAVLIACNGGSNSDSDNFLGIGDDSNGSGPGNSALSFSPSLLDFGDIALSSSTTSSVTVTNVSDQAVYLTNIQGENSFFSRVGGTCFSGSGLLAVDATCTVTIQFTALTGGDHEGIFSFNYGTEPGDTDLTANLSLEGSAGVNPPTNYSLTNVAGTTVTIGWNDNSTNETSFEVNRCTGTVCAATFTADFTDFTAANATSYAFTGLTEGEYYRFRVRAVTGTNQSTWLEGSVMVTFGGIASVDDNGTGMADLTSLDCRTEAEGAYVSLSWNSVPDATNYFIYDVTGSGNTLLKTVSAPATSAIVTGLTINTAYNLLVTTGTSTGFISENATTTALTTTDYLPCIVLGKAEMTGGANAAGLQNPTAVKIYGGKMYLADRNNHRVLIWNTPPTGPTDLPDIVLGQDNMFSNYINNTPGNIGTVSGQSMNYPFGLWVGSIGGADRLLVADSSNNRILVWTSLPTTNHQAADLVLGQANLTINTADGGDVSRGLQNPYDVYSDGTKIYATDTGNHRTLIWNSFPATNFATPDVYLGQPDSTTTSSGCGADEMNSPQGVWSDGSRMMVAISSCHRVAIYESIPGTGTNPNPDTILGQTSLTGNSSSSAADKMNSPKKVRVFGSQIFVADYGRNRVKVWNSIPAPGNHGVASDFVIGLSNTGNSSGSQQNRLQNPTDIEISGTTVYVSDYNNYRIMGFNSIPTGDGTNADFLFGQGGFDKEVLNYYEDTNERSYDQPQGMAYDGTQFFVADPDRHRVLVYNGIPSSWNQDADYVLGQGNFSLQSSGRNQAALSAPRGVCVGGGQLWVPDYNNNRVMVFDLPITTNSPNAAAVLGQTSWTTNTTGTGLDQPRNPIACHYDGSKFFVVDRGYDRVLVWNSLPSMATVADNPAADFMLGTTTGNQTSQNQLYDPWGIYSDGTKLYVADAGNHRVMVWNSLTGVDDQNADFYLGGNTNWTSRNGLVSATGLNYPIDIVGDGGSGIYVLDASNGRVMKFDNPVATNDFASTVYGKSSFTDTTEPGNESMSLSTSARSLLRINNRLFVSDQGHSRVIATPIAP